MKELKMLSFNSLYQLKNLVLRTPFTYGHYRKLRKFRDDAYDHDHDKHPVREKHNGQGGWQPGTNGDFRYRDYESYDEYVTHQKQKFNEILKMQGGFDNKTILLYRKTFYRRFRWLPSFLNKSAVILCLGARQGTEVEVLWDLGYKNAIGLDLNPGPENPYVRKGDFMSLEYSDNSIDMVYSNCVDHAFDLSKYFQEHVRVLKPGGYAIYDIGISGQGFGSFEAVGWERDETVFLLALQHYTRVLKVEEDKAWKWLLLKK
jgi:SAM-dependent methyltransferase